MTLNYIDVIDQAILMVVYVYIFVIMFFQNQDMILSCQMLNVFG